MKHSDLVSVIIATYNGSEYLDTCLASVTNTSYKNLEICLIDDGSTDSSVQLIKKWQAKDARIILTQNSQNMGAAASRNKAAKLARGQTLVFLDNDTQVDPEWLSSLLNSLAADKSIGASQALIVDFQDRKKIQMAGGLLERHTGWLIPAHQGQPYPAKNILPKNIVAISAALAVRRQAFDQAGGFDNLEGVYTEDLDFCWRLWICGYKIVLSPKSIVYHYSKSVVAREKMQASLHNIYFHLAKNSIRSMVKNYELKNLILYLPFSLGINLGRGLMFLVATGSIHALSASIEAVVWNLYNLSNLVETRRQVQAKRKNSDQQLFETIFTKDKLLTIYQKYYK